MTFLKKVMALFRNFRWTVSLPLLVLCVAGIAVRLTDLTNPPLDVHAWRQLRSAAIARSIYYDLHVSTPAVIRQQAHDLRLSMQELEPPIFEWTAALTYQIVGNELLWIPRIYSAFFWLIGGIALFDLCRRCAGIMGAFFSLAYYLFLPFAVQHSRIFMPDPLMVMLIVLAIWAADRWVEKSKWSWAIVTGVLTGTAILVKVFAVYLLFPSLAALVLVTWGLRGTLHRPQTWVVAGLAALVPSFYYIASNPGGGGLEYLRTWSLPYLHMLTDPLFYLAWFRRLSGLFGIAFISGAMVSITLFRGKGRALAVSLWLGYLLLGLTVPSLIRSHIYYNLPLTVIVAFSIAPLGQLVLDASIRQGVLWRLVTLGALVVWMGDFTLTGRNLIKTVNYRSEPTFWQELSQKLPPGGTIIGLTEDYNMRMQYFGRCMVGPYPYSFDQDMVRLTGRSFDENADNDQYFLDKTQSYDYFLITMPDELVLQPYLARILERYPLVAEFGRARLYDLRHPSE